ncbi:hypothetical protein RCJ22_20220 [Vibrio sp. FNV 38]|nr:hypothetical protein [Vibrio sp. FNV 38]
MFIRTKVILAMSATALLSACASNEPVVVEEKPTSPQDIATEMQRQENQAVLASVPDWYLSTQHSSRGAIYENATATSKDLQFALNQAILLAEQQVVKKMATEITSLEVNEISESNGGSFNQSAEQIIEARVNQAGLFGHSVSKKEVLIDPATGEYRAFVQVFLPPAARADILKAAAEKDERIQEISVLEAHINELEAQAADTEA